jgi:manganese/zinc/iron transport system permease protein
MTSAQIEIQLIASLVAIACALPGTFLVLRKMAMISDAISHSILPGIVLGFFITQDLNSPLLIVLAALTGVVTVMLVEFIQRTKLVKEDTATTYTSILTPSSSASSPSRPSIGWWPEVPTWVQNLCG